VPHEEDLLSSRDGSRLRGRRGCHLYKKIHQVTLAPLTYFVVTALVRRYILVCFKGQTEIIKRSVGPGTGTIFKAGGGPNISSKSLLNFASPPLGSLSSAGGDETCGGSGQKVMRLQALNAINTL